MLEVRTEGYEWERRIDDGLLGTAILGAEEEAFLLSRGWAFVSETFGGVDAE